MLSKDDFDRATVNSQMTASEITRKTDRFRNDSKEDLRLIQGLCRCCFYLRGVVAGRARTKYTCKGCDGDFVNSDTNVPQICKACSEKHKVCMKCLAYLDKI